MVNKTPRVVIIGAGMAGLTAACKLYTSPNSNQLFELSIVEGGDRIGGRINSSEFCGDKIELEGGLELNPSLVEPISRLFKNLLNYIQGKPIVEDGSISEIVKHCGPGNLSVGSFLREGLEAYWGFMKDEKGIKRVGNWSMKSLEEAIFTMHENTHRSYSSADDLSTLDFNAEREYKMLPGEEITIAKGYLSVIEPVKLHFSDGSILSADHVIVTVSLGVLKRGIIQDHEMFDPPLPSIKNRSISRLGYGLVNKVFLQLPQETDGVSNFKFPFLQMVFHQPNSEFRDPKVPHWIRRTSLLYPIYSNSRVVLSWVAGSDALQLESLSDDEIINGFSITASNMLPSKFYCQMNPNQTSCHQNQKQLKFDKVLRTEWGTNPLFLGSYSYVAVGSSEDDMDVLAEPLPQNSNNIDGSSPQLQILFAGEATHRTHYSTTHGAYFSGLREANRLLKHYNCAGV
ncbi:hypothetical protein DH2020_026641 [Rehmannia glutinosa]|uniref:Amine oxidase domain-containing protein n=1 Tax=Rehmannia glutinosa TaxID=99300 RepID=A0ABR0W082_REHGL